MVKLYQFIFNGSEGEVARCRAYESARWDALDKAAEFPEASRAPRRVAYWAYYSAKLAGILGELGVADKGEDEAVAFLNDCYFVDFQESEIPFGTSE